MGMIGIPTVPLDDSAQRALAEWLVAHKDEINEVLRPHGVTADHVELPRFRRLINRDDLADLAVFLGRTAATPAYGSTRAPLPAADVPGGVRERSGGSASHSAREDG